MVKPIIQTAAAATTARDTATSANASKASTTSSTTTRLLLFSRDAVLATVLFLLLSTTLMQHFFTTILQPLTDSYRRTEGFDGYFEEFRNDHTYYARHCSELDIPSTQSANDLLVPNMHQPGDTYEQTGQAAAERMLRHGALAFTNVLDNTTVQELRAYLSSRHAIRDQLSWNEVMWNGEDGTRLSLGLGTHDHPAITKALQQVGRHAALQAALEGILGPDPAIVEVSTLTSLTGAHSQGLHTDTDWYGSSLQFSRTFLHSYSFFVALQDTPQALGATTVCPGSHRCADEDLVDLCEDHGFSVSTNGHTGPEHGLFQQGDAFLFHQNIWHRGPAVHDDGRHTDRVMFILSFVSRNKASESDRRQQGLGTYYYQRWNMWAATFRYLANAGQSMGQPWSALRALGLYHPAGRNVGLYWWETFCQQLAAGDFFYAPYELVDFRQRVLDKIHFPDFLRSQARNWEDFLEESLQIWTTLAKQVYGAVLVVSLSIWYVWRSSTTTDKSAWQSQRMGRLVWVHVVLVGLFLFCQWYIAETLLAQSVKSGEIFFRPFPEPHQNMTTNTVGPSAFPERTDVLLATRFDAPFLGAYNQWIDFHPGNEEWRSMVDLAAHNLPPKLHAEAAAMIVATLARRPRHMGYPSTRFLWQDYDTGAWRLVSDTQAVEETRRAIVARAHPQPVGSAWQSLKYQLAEARFGATRESAMSRHVIPPFVQDVTDALFDVERNEFLRLQQGMCHPDEAPDGTLSSLVWKNKFQTLLDTSSVVTTPPPKVDIGTTTTTESSPFGYKIGAMVWGLVQETGEWLEAVIMDEGDDDLSWFVEFLSEDDRDLPERWMRGYLHVKEGDKVAVDFEGNGMEYFAGTITSVKPSGHCSVLFDDGDYKENMKRHNILSLEEFADVDDSEATE